MYEYPHQSEMSLLIMSHQTDLHRKDQAITTLLNEQAVMQLRHDAEMNAARLELVRAQARVAELRESNANQAQTIASLTGHILDISAELQTEKALRAELASIVVDLCVGIREGDELKAYDQARPVLMKKHKIKV